MKLPTPALYQPASINRFGSGPASEHPIGIDYKPYQCSVFRAYFAGSMPSRSLPYWLGFSGDGGKYSNVARQW